MAKAKKKIKLSPKEKQRLELGIIISISILSIIFWESIVIYPIKMFVVMFHEISHGLAVVFSGGKIESIQFSQYLGGACSAKGGNKIVISSAGYLGSLVVGSLLFIFSYDRKKIQILNIILAVILIFFTANFFIGSGSITFAMLFAILLLVSPKYFPPAVNSYTMRTLGLISVLYVLTDIKEDLITLTYRETDAQLLADATNIPAIFWGALWFLITAVTVYYLFRYSYKEGLKY